MDNVLIACKKCPSYDVLYKNYIDNSPEIQMVYNEWGNLFSQWSSKTGSSVKTIDDVIHLHNVLTIEKKRFNWYVVSDVGRDQTIINFRLVYPIGRKKRFYRMAKWNTSPSFT